MSAVNVPQCPPSLKQIQHYLKTAAEHDGRDIVVAYWCRLYALQVGLKTDKSSPEAKKLLLFLMDWLEKTKEQNKENEAITHDIPGQAHVENYALKLFLYADKQDRESNFNKNVVKAFYTAGILFDVLETFGELTEEVLRNRKYAKWKAAYIHNCLKNGEMPLPGPLAAEGETQIDFNTTDNPTPTEGSQDEPAPPSNQESNEPALPVLPTPPESQNPDPLSPPVDYKVPSPPPQSGVELSPEQMTKAQKYCKWASSALNYEDVTTAIVNLQKALTLLTTGNDES